MWTTSQQANIPLTIEERAQTILLIEDEALPDEAVTAVAERVPNLEALGKEAFIEGFQIAVGAMAAFVLLSLLLASLIPKVAPEAVLAEEVRAAVADVASKRV